ncbi:MAG: S41 family peptidase, partial [Desulfobacteraceae bacterium]|nr:S41 family peptidase [Desulfobacteraceae bacterium]
MKTDESRRPPDRFPKSLAGSWRLGLAVAVGVGMGWLCPLGCAPPHQSLNYSLMSQAWDTIENHYMDRSAVKPLPATYGAIQGMVASLGDTGHSTFLSPEMVKELKITVHGELKGIGIKIQSRQGHVVIVAPIDGSPAQRAGLRSGDIILKVSGQDITGWPITKVEQQISGPPGTKVTLSVLSPRTGHIREVTVTRATIKLHNVTWRRLPGTDMVHLRISSFDGGVAEDFAKALVEIRKQKVGGIILDLRNNPGGVLDEGVRVASQFLHGGNVLLVKNAKGHIHPVAVKPGGMMTDVPMVVLVNLGTASASEIVAGALRDRHRAPLVGETTFGTGTVLGEFRLADGSALLLAVEEWLTPDGHSFWHKGITPKYQVARS